MLASPLLSSAFLTLAVAGPPKVGVAPPIVSGDSATHIVDEFQDQVRQSLSAQGVEVVTLEPGWAGDCTGGDCLGPAMESAGVDYVVAVESEIIDRDFETTLKVYDRSGGVLDEKDASCEICTPDEAAASAAEQAALLTEGLEAAPEPEPEPEPEGPEPEPAPAAAEPKPKADISTRQYVGYGLAGGGLVTMISGIVMIAVDKKPYGPKCDDSNTDANGECEFRNKTLGGGTVLTVVGGLAAGVGATLVVLDLKDRGKLSVAPTGRGLKLEGRF